MIPNFFSIKNSTNENQLLFLFIKIQFLNPMSDLRPVSCRKTGGNNVPNVFEASIIYSMFVFGIWELIIDYHSS